MTRSRIEGKSRVPSSLPGSMSTLDPELPPDTARKVLESQRSHLDNMSQLESTRQHGERSDPGAPVLRAAVQYGSAAADTRAQSSSTSQHLQRRRGSCLSKSSQSSMSSGKSGGVRLMLEPSDWPGSEFSARRMTGSSSRSVCARSVCARSRKRQGRGEMEY